MKCKKMNLAVIALSLAVLLIYVFAVDGARGLLDALLAASPVWLGMAVALMAVYWLLEAVILHLAVKRFHPRQRFFKTLQTSMVGQLFNCITPFASGGQPVQAYHMTKTGVPLGASACALTIKFVIYQFVLTIYSLITLIFKFRAFSQEIANLKYLVLAGFAVNTAVIAGLLCICFCRDSTGRFLRACTHLLAKMRLVRDEAGVNASMEIQIAQFYESFRVIRGNWGLMLKMGLLSALQLTSYFLIPYMLLRCFQAGGVSVFSMLVAQAFVLNVSSFVPLPGAAGGAELSFYTMFAMFFPARVLALAVLLWRIITFYLPICVGTVFTWSFSPAKRGKAIPE